MKPEEIKEHLLGILYNEDRFGNFVRKFDNMIRRYKFGKRSLRAERRANRVGSKWHNENYGRTIYYKDVFINIEGNLRAKQN